MDVQIKDQVHPPHTYIYSNRLQVAWVQLATQRPVFQTQSALRLEDNVAYWIEDNVSL